MKRLTVTFILSVILLFTLCACGIPEHENAPAADWQQSVTVESSVLHCHQYEGR